MHRNLRALALLGSLLLLPSTAAAQPATWTDWARVRNVPAGDKVEVTTTAHPSAEYRMAFADDSQLVLVKPVGHVSARTVDAMNGIGRNWPAVLGGRVFEVGDIRISSAGIQEAGARVAIVEIVPRAAVVEIRREGSDVAMTLWTLAGVGALLAARNNGYIEESRRREGLPPVGTPFPTPQQISNWPEGTRGVIYRRAGVPFQPIDEGSWERQLRGVPASLRGKGPGRQ